MDSHKRGISALCDNCPQNRKRRRRTKNKGTFSYGKKKRNMKGTGCVRQQKSNRSVAARVEVNIDMETECENSEAVVTSSKCVAVNRMKMKIFTSEEYKQESRHLPTATCVKPNEEKDEKISRSSEGVTQNENMHSASCEQLYEDEDERNGSSDGVTQNEVEDTASCEKPNEYEDETTVESSDGVTNSDFLEAYFQACVEALTDKEMVDSLVRRLHETDALDQFIILVTSLAAGMFDPENIVFLLCLERCHFETLKTTTQMRYRDKTKLFWKLLYKETSGKAIRMASGPKSKGAVVEKISQRGHYDPKEAKANFAVPDVKVLSANLENDWHLPQEINPGLIHANIHSLPSDKDIVLLGDGKGLARGQLPGGRGDVDLFGHEDPPTKQQLQQILNDTELSVEQLQNDVSVASLLDLAENASKIIRSLKSRSDYFSVRRQGMITRYRKEENKNKYEHGMSWVNAMDYKIRMASERMFELMGQIARLISYINQCEGDFLATSVLDTSKVLLLKNPEDLEGNYDLHSATDLVKPGTEMWHKLRREAYVTADNVFSAIGMCGVNAMKKHHKLVTDNTVEEIPTCIPSSADIAIVASKVLPVVFADATIKQTGIHFRDTEITERFIAASPHCVLQLGKDVTMPVTIDKKDFSAKDPFKLSNAVLVRTQCEMFVLDAENSLVVTIMSNKLCAQMVKINSSLVEKIIQIAVDIYDKEDQHDIQLPKAVDMTWKEEILTGLNELRDMLDLTTTVLCFPLPSFSDIEVNTDSVSGPFLQSCPKLLNDISKSFVEESTQGILQTCSHQLGDAHTLLRPQADEIFTVMATDTDRVNTGVPAQFPVAYGLKGGGLSTKKLRDIMDEVKDELVSHDINVVCEIFDGYHHTYMERDSAGLPLYRTKLQQDTWKLFSDLGKSKLISRLEEISSTKDSLPNLMQLGKLQSGSIEKGNILVKREGGSSVLLAYCRGGPLNTTGVLEKFHSPGPMLSSQQNHIDFTCTNIVDELPTEDLLDTTIVYDESNCDEKSQVVSSALLHQSPLFLQWLTQRFRNQSRKKWKKLTPEVLLKTYLTDADVMAKCFTMKEFAFVEEEVKCLTGSELFSKDCKIKARKSSVVSQFFGGSGKVTGLSLNTQLLSELCRKQLLRSDYPVDHLRISLAVVYHHYRKEDWLAHARVPMVQQVDKEGNTIALFSYPEFHQGRQKLEPKVTDPYHILTNLRKGATSGNYEKGVSPDQQLCSSKAWHKVVQEDNTLLTYSIVQDCADKQSGHLARRVFSEEVEKILHKVGEEKTAEFVFHVRKFFEACDKRGIRADNRIADLVGMHKYLTSGVNFDSFPPPGSWVKGIPIVTFEAILANVSTRIQLYSICSQGTYNHRAISSLACENFFSTLANTSPTGAPRAADIPRTMSHIISLNHFKHVDPETLGFYFQTAAKLVYDVHTLDKPREGVSEDGFWKDHQFDVVTNVKKNSKYDRASFTHGLKPMKGVRPIRTRYYKIDEQKLNTLKRMGLDSSDLLRFGIPLEWQL